MKNYYVEQKNVSRPEKTRRVNNSSALFGLCKHTDTQTETERDRDRDREETETETETETDLQGENERRRHSLDTHYRQRARERANERIHHHIPLLNRIL